MTIWLGTIIVGFGFIYFSQMYGSNFRYDGLNLDRGLFSAMYFSAAQLSTIGTSQITPETDGLRALSILETLTGLALVTVVISFLLGIYQVVRDLRALSSNFALEGNGADDPLAGLGVYLAREELDCLDNHLRAISANFWSYADGLRQHRLAYYFQSGRDRFALPYVMRMLGHWLAALRWGLPSGHPSSVQPLVAPLTTRFALFCDDLEGRFGWKIDAPPKAVSLECFSAAYGADGEIRDRWLDRFVRLDRQMARLARVEPAANPRDAHARYQQWLPFAHRAEQVTAIVSRNLDDRPFLRA